MGGGEGGCSNQHASVNLLVKGGCALHVITLQLLPASIFFPGSPEELKQFDKYMDALNAWCYQQIQPLKAQHNIMPVCGQPVCVKHTDTNQWRRAQVTRLSNR